MNTSEVKPKNKADLRDPQFLKKIKEAVQKKVDEANRHLASLSPSELEKIRGRSKKTA